MMLLEPKDPLWRANGQTTAEATHEEVAAVFLGNGSPTRPFDSVDVRTWRLSRRRMATFAAISCVLVSGVGSLQLVSDPVPTPSGPVSNKFSAQALNLRTASLSPSSKQHVALGANHAPIYAKSFAKCVAYDLTTLKGRAFAFEGTVSSVVARRPPMDVPDLPTSYLTVTLIVHEWFRGGDQATVKLDMLSRPAPGRVGSPEGTIFGIGKRLLVSGGPRFGGRPLDDPVASPCGFTRDYDRSTASAWRQILGKDSDRSVIGGQRPRGPNDPWGARRSWSPDRP
jgi:hypothetical protein